MSDAKSEVDPRRAAEYEILDKLNRVIIRLLLLLTVAFVFIGGLALQQALSAKSHARDAEELAKVLTVRLDENITRINSTLERLDASMVRVEKIMTNVAQDVGVLRAKVENIEKSTTQP